MSIFRRLLAMAAPVWPSLAIAVVFAALTSIANIGLLASAAYLLSAAALMPSIAALAPVIVGVRFFALVRALCRYAERYTAHDATFRLLSRSRVRLYQSVERLAVGQIAAAGGADLMQRIIVDVESLKYFFLRVLLPPAAALLVMTGMLFFLNGMVPEVAVLLLASFVIAGMALPLVYWRLAASAGQRLVEARARLNIALADSVKGLRDLAELNANTRLLLQMDKKEHDYLQAQSRVAVLDGLGDAAGFMLANLAVLAVLAMTITLVADKQLDGVYLAALAMAVQGTLEAWLPLMATGRYWDESWGAARRLFAIDDTVPAIVEPMGSPAVPTHYDLTVRNLSFRYPPAGRQILHDVSFTLPAGRRMAIVGSSGAGKSTLAALLLRCWDYDTGSIRLGECELKDIRSETVRELIGVVAQDTYVFNATVRDNLLLAKPQASEDEVSRAAAGAVLTGLAGSMAEGLALEAGDNGHSLSGGERQRLAIARILLKNPPVLVMDEPTVSLDAATEQEVMRTILAATAGRTTVLITHRLTGLAAMDFIVVLDEGRVVESGSFAGLIAQRGLFYQMWQSERDIVGTNW